MAENLKKTLNIDGTEYDINAVYSDKAGKVTNPLIVKRSGNAAFNFDGSTAGQTIDYVPTTGGTFSGKVYIDHANAEDEDLGGVTNDELLNCDQIKHLVCDLTQHPLYSWEGNKLDNLKNVHGALSGLNVVVGTTEEFKAFKRIMGVPDITSTNEETRYYGLRISSSTPYTEGHVDYRTRTNSTYTDVYLPSYGYYNTLSTGIIDLSKGVPVTTIREEAFKGNKTIEMVEIPESITTIGSYAFSGCSALKSIKLPSKLERLNTETFKGCTGLKSIVIGKNVKKISKNVFNLCSNLKTVYYEGTEDDWLAFNKVDTITYTDDTKQINNTGNTALTDVYTKSKAGEDGYSFIFNYTYTTEFIDLPCLYICTDFGTNNLNTDNVNKMFLKMPNTGIFVELSRGATYLESALTPSAGSYTYESLAAIVAKINTRLDALGLNKVTIPEVKLDPIVVLPDSLKTEVTSDPIAEKEEDIQDIPTIKSRLDSIEAELSITDGSLDTRLDKIESEIGIDSSDYKADTRIDTIEKELWVDNSGESMIDKLKNGKSFVWSAVTAMRLTTTTKNLTPDKANSLAQQENKNNFVDAGDTNTPVYFEDGVPKACGSSLDVNITGTAKTATDYDTTTGSIKEKFDSIEKDKVSKSATTAQNINSGLIIGTDYGVQYTNNGVTVTGSTNPLVTLQAIDEANNLLTPYYIQVFKEKDKEYCLYFGPTYTNAVRVDKNGNTYMPADLDINGSIKEGGKLLADKYAAKDHGTHLEEIAEIEDLSGDEKDRVKFKIGNATFDKEIKWVFDSTIAQISNYSRTAVKLCKEPAAPPANGESVTLLDCGDNSTPVYFKDGVPVACGFVSQASNANLARAANYSGRAARMCKERTTPPTGENETFENVSLGDSSTPIYFADGLPTKCTNVTATSYEVVTTTKNADGTTTETKSTQNIQDKFDSLISSGTTELTDGGDWPADNNSMIYFVLE